MMTGTDSTETRAFFRPIIAIPALVTGLLAIAIPLTEVYNPAGSPYAPLFLLLIIWAHCQLLLPSALPLKERLTFPIAPRTAWILAVTGTLLLGLFITNESQERIRENPLVLKTDAQMGLMAQVVARIQEPQHKMLYETTYRRDNYTQRNSFLPGLIMPYYMARSLGLEWRYATVATICGFFALLLVLLFGWSRSGWSPAAEEENAVAFLAFLIAGSLWFLLPENRGMLQWLHVAPVWMMMVVTGIGFARDLPILSGLGLGCLAAMSPGWMLMLIPGVAILWRGRSRALAIGALLVPVLLSVGFARGEWMAMARGLLADQFESGNAATTPWRYVTIHALGDWLLLRPMIYVVALVGLFVVASKILSPISRERRLNLLAFSSFLIILCAPVAYAFHWISHSIWLAALLPASSLASEATDHEVVPRTLAWEPGDWMRSGLMVGALVAAVLLPFSSGFGGGIDQRASGYQQPDEYPLYGFHWAGPETAWGNGTSMTVGLPISQPVGGLLELRIGTLDGRFTAMNPFHVKVNGIDKGKYFILPGDYDYAQVPVKQSDLFVGVNIIEIEPAWARIPTSLKVGDDIRTISLNLQGLRFIPGMTLDALEEEVESLEFTPVMPEEMDKSTEAQIDNESFDT